MCSGYGGDVGEVWGRGTHTSPTLCLGLPRRLLARTTNATKIQARTKPPTTTPTIVVTLASGLPVCRPLLSIAAAGPEDASASAAFTVMMLVASETVVCGLGVEVPGSTSVSDAGPVVLVVSMITVVTMCVAVEIGAEDTNVPVAVMVVAAATVDVALGVGRGVVTANAVVLRRWHVQTADVPAAVVACASMAKLQH